MILKLQFACPTAGSACPSTAFTGVPAFIFVTKSEFLMSFEDNHTRLATGTVRHQNCTIFSIHLMKKEELLLVAAFPGVFIFSSITETVVTD